MRLPARLTPRFAARSALYTLLFVVAGSSVGCADMLTYAGDARQEGIKQYNAGQYPEAVGSFSNAVKQRPQDYESYYYLGRTFEAMKNYHQAVSDYATSLNLMANSLKGKDDFATRNKALDGLAASIAAGKDPSLEQAAFVRHGGPNSAEDFFVLAKVRRLQGDMDSALQEFAKAAQANPKSLPIAKEYGLYLLQLNQPKLATVELRRAYALNFRMRNPEDEEINKGLRDTGVVPGPSLANEGDLTQPVIPRGPLPELEIGGEQATSSQ